MKDHIIGFHYLACMLLWCSDSGWIIYSCNCTG